MPVYFIQSSQVHHQNIQISGELAHHLRDVLRFKLGRTFDVVDELRRRYRVSMDKITPDYLSAQILSVEEPEPRDPLNIILAQAILKRSRMDWAVQKATELGVAKLVPLLTERTVVRSSPDRLSHQRDRWLKIAKEAAQQCGRGDVPAVQAPTDFSWLDQSAPIVDLRLILWEQETNCTLRSILRTETRIRSLILVVGPEGGFTPKEIGQTREAGYQVATLGTRVLRAETAGLCALSILQHEIGDMG